MFEDSITKPGFTAAQWFTEPSESILISSSDRPDCNSLKSQILQTIRDVENKAKAGSFLFGVFHYELGFYLENRLFPLAENLPKGTKLLEIFLFNNKQVIQYVSPNLNELDDSSIITHTPQITKDEYLNKINAAKQYLTDGESYELNYTFPTKLVAKGDPFLLYQKLKRRQFTRYSAYFENAGNFVLSFSPELFWDWKGKSIQVKPMKGTARRKENYLEDLDVAHNLENSVKERAENVMITDLFRNDLAKISEMGTVEVNELFSAEALDSVWQMTSKVSATLLPDIQFGDMVTQLFPSGSVTGAPKIRSIELISELEKRIRGIYTGSIFTFEYSDTEIRSVGNVAIRTMTLTKQNGQLKGDYAVGSGITVLSDPSAEYEECLSKFSFLTGKDVPDFEILETIRFDSGRYRLLSLHLERMEWSAKRFQYPFDQNQAKETLESIAQVASGLLRVRLLLNRKGDFRAETFDFTRTKKQRKVNLCLSDVCIDKNDVFLYHKTTVRDFYNDVLKYASANGADDIILLDQNGNVCETALRNIFFKREGIWYTPTLSCGGLPGTLRKRLLQKGWIKELDLPFDDLLQSEEILVGNSLRGLERVNLQEGLQNKST